MVSRIKQLLDWQQLSPTQFADRIGIGRPVISHILSERNKPSLDVVQRILTAFPELSTNWLIKGEGEMLAAREPVMPPTPAAPLVAMPATAGPTVPVAPFRPTAAPAALPAAPSPATAVAATPPAEPVQPASAPKAAPRPAIARFAPAPAKATPSATAPLAEPESMAPSSAVGATGSAYSSAKPATPLRSLPEEAPVLPLTPAIPALPATAPVSAAPTLADVFGESGKAIRRIVIFYRDGSFADYQPEG